MKLSIIVPMYNSCLYIERCVESIISELRETDELIIIDDGSVDQSFNLCKRYINNQVNVYHNSNHGVSYSRNFGIDKAKGDYITFIDSDDFFFKGWRGILECGIKTQSDIVYFTQEKDVKLDYLGIIYNTICQNGNINTTSCWAKLYKRSFIRKNEIKFLTKLNLGEDASFNLCALSFLPKISILYSKKFYNYCINPDSVTRSSNINIVENLSSYISTVSNYLDGIESVSTHDRNEIIYTCMVLSIFQATYHFSFSKNYNYARKGYIKTRDLLSFLQISTIKTNKNLSMEKNMVYKLFYKEKYALLFAYLSIRVTIKKILKR